MEREFDLTVPIPGSVLRDFLFYSSIIHVIYEEPFLYCEIGNEEIKISDLRGEVSFQTNSSNIIVDMIQFEFVRFGEKKITFVGKNKQLVIKSNDYSVGQKVMDRMLEAGYIVE